MGLLYIREYLHTYIHMYVGVCKRCLVPACQPKRNVDVVVYYTTDIIPLKWYVIHLQFVVICKENFSRWIMLIWNNLNNHQKLHGRGEGEKFIGLGEDCSLEEREGCEWNEQEVQLITLCAAQLEWRCEFEILIRLDLFEWTSWY